MSLFNASNVPFCGTKGQGHLARDRAKGHCPPLARPEIPPNVPVLMSRLVSFEEVFKFFSYEPTTGIVRWACDLSPRRTAGQAVSLKKQGSYITVILFGYGYKAHRIAWMLTYGQWPNHEIDHINGERWDNRIANLRDVSHQVNQMNQRCHRAARRAHARISGAAA